MTAILEMKMSILAYDIIIYVENLTDSKKLLELICEFSKLAGYNISIQKSGFSYVAVVSLCYFVELFLLWKEVEFCQMLFMHQLRWLCVFFPLYYWCGILHWSIMSQEYNHQNKEL